MYPVMLDVRDRRCLVVGGGTVAARKVEGLHAEGARVTVIAPEAVDELLQLAASGGISLERRDYRAGEARDYALVFAATSDRQVNRRVFEDASAAGIWANVADDPELCSFHLAARVQRGALQLVVGSGGEAPFVVRRLRQLFERRLGPEWSEWIEAAGRFRRRVRQRRLSRVAEEACFDRFFAETVNSEAIAARVPTAAEQQAMIARDDAKRPGGGNGAAPRRAPVPAAADRRGFVSLVGAGPGDAGLLTVRGRQRLLAADAVAYDRLAATALPCDLKPQVELHCVGKNAGNHPVPQEEITSLLVRLARQGKRVVRLKGGDPYVFGRGGEEAEVLRDAGIPFEVIPAVTAGVAVPAYAGIPVTHRGEVVRVTMVTAHEAIKRDGPQVRWDLIAGDPHATIVGYMGVSALPRVVEQLLAGGMDPQTPAAMIERGTTSRQLVVRSTVSGLPEAIERAGLHPPALFVIGPAVRHAEQLDWFGQRPLLGERIGCFGGLGKLGEQLELAGVELVEVPLPVTPAARVVIGALPLTGWIFRNPDEVAAIDAERDGPGWSADVVSWCLDATAARRARELGWSMVEQLPPSHDAGLLTALLQRREARASAAIEDAASATLHDKTALAPEDGGVPHG